ncbi:uncharacterized protein LOC124272485 isoform X1 [Haliotis rubra]|uniref:uncharacterized protein LOC124272485 isoform X1 n=1 Tax=Haliotis rubra TaxID=36100 RepID=UPI001EE6245F|nr:uncharacterized protein LOC124272485 isoform X1 [Haliotis rubra]XP_046563627.1 uncharacterized protein LOC124272485 isoform X1 [Haliotis rubra]XP_046563628.1 uncharacterized protein LOC124272485 isoform X1 [Haliotis rubra]XP_046563629.1 uncharacterized protein LOC124272485 isoform X1 [Haliotis rubra]
MEERNSVEASRRIRKRKPIVVSTGMEEGNSVEERNYVDARCRLFAPFRHLEKMGYRLRLLENESLAVVHVPGLSDDAFDVDGNCHVWSIAKIISAAVHFAHNYPLDSSERFFLDFGILSDGLLTFMASSSFEFDKSLYDPLVSKWPLKINVQLGYIGKSSTNFVSNIVEPSSGKILVRNTIQLVAIDKETRKPTPFPPWWKEKHGEKAVRKEPLIVQKLSKPDNAHTYTLRVSWSETDMYKHVNWASYVVYSINALHHGIKEGVLRGVSKEVVRNGVQKMQMAYFGECVEGDQLTVYFWEVEDQPRTVYFDIEKDGTSVFQNTLTYHQ